MKKQGNDFKLEIKSQVKNRAEIVMYGDISKYDISAESLTEVLASLDDSISELDIRIFSGGGDVFQGVAIYNILKRSNKKITMYIDGLAASIASVIILAADKIVIGEGSLVMVHLPWAMGMGNKNELQGTIDRLEMVEREMVKIYTKATGLSDTEVIEMMTKETWFDDAKAIEFGFATDKIEASQTFSIAASVQNCEWITRKENAKDNLEFKNKIQENITKFSDILARK